MMVTFMAGPDSQPTTTNSWRFSNDLALRHRPRLPGTLHRAYPSIDLPGDDALKTERAGVLQGMSSPRRLLSWLAIVLKAELGVGRSTAPGAPCAR